MGRKKNMTKRSEILKTAYRMFCEKGFEQVLLREIAEEVEISKALLQHYFSRLWHVYNSVAWFYLTGMIVSAFALRNLIMIAKFPAKKSLKDKKVIW